MSPRREADLDATDSFLPLVFGVVSLFRRFDTILEMVPARSGTTPDDRAILEPEDRSTMYLLLGLIAFRDRWRAHLDEASQRPSEATSAAPTSEHPTTAGTRLRLLR